MQPKYPETREELFDALAPTIDETVRYRVAIYLQELCGAVPKDLHRIVVEAAEGAAISSVLEYTKGNQVLAAEYLGISRSTLRNKARSNQ